MSIISSLGKSHISEDDCKDICNDLNKCLDTISNMTDILNRSTNQDDYIKLETYKKVEDGILDSIHNANNLQRNFLLKGGFKFRYYLELNDTKVLQREINLRMLLNE